MDIVREINGRKQVFCLPASQYIAGLMKKDIHEAYDIEVELTGTGAIIKKYSTRKHVRVKFKAAKSFIKQYGRIKDVPDDMPWYEVSKDKFYKNFLQEPKKVRKWKSRRGKG